MKVDVTVQNPTIQRFLSMLSGAGKVELNRAMAVEVQQATVDHLTRLAASRHDTANRLGAAPSGHLAQAAEKVAGPQSVITIGTDAAALIINHPGLIRAFKSVTIKPGPGRKALAIPMNALSYNRLASSFGRGALFILGGGKMDIGKNILALKQAPGMPIVALYYLVKSVTQKQDRTLLPSDQEWRAAAARGALTYISQIPD